MKVVLEQITKKFNREWIFKNVNLEFISGDRVAVLGSNGSGKSTIIQIISGYLTPSNGRISWENESGKIAAGNIYRYLSICAPYLQQDDELTLRENVAFFLKFKTLRNQIGIEEFAQIVQLEKNLDKPLKFYSSGMRQRVKLGLAILADTPLLLLDEPTSHLDKKGIEWYQTLLRENAGERTIFVASNSEETETFICDKKIFIEQYKS